MTELKYPNGESSGLFAVPVPKDAVGFIESDEFQCIGEVTSDLISFDVEPYVHNNSDGIECDYMDYETKEWNASGVEDSFLSLLSFNGLCFSNPYGEKPKFHPLEWWSDKKYDFEAGEYHEKNKSWQAAESSVVHKLLIIKKK